MNVVFLVVQVDCQLGREKVDHAIEKVWLSIRRPSEGIVHRSAVG